MKNRNQHKYLKVTDNEPEVTNSELKEKFEYFLKMRFPQSLRPTGKRKWKSFFWVLQKGYYRSVKMNEGFQKNWTVFLIAIPSYFYGFILLMIFLEIPGFNFEMIPDPQN